VFSPPNVVNKPPTIILPSGSTTKAWILPFRHARAALHVGTKAVRTIGLPASVTREVLAEPSLKKFVQQEISKMSEAMIARLNADKQAGLLPQSFEPAIVVPIIVTYLQGQWRMALVSYDRSQFEKRIDVFLTGLGL
jgi:hypothetical protein